MRLSRLAAIAALGLGLVLLTYLSVATADVLAQTPTAATPGTPRPATPGTPAATPRPATPTVAPAVTPAATPTPTRAVTPVTPTRAPSPSPIPTRVGPFGAGGSAGSGLDGQYVTALWVVGWGLVTLGSLYLVLRRRRA